MKLVVLEGKKYEHKYRDNENYTGFCLKRVTELFYIAVNDFDANKSAGCGRVLIVIELVGSESVPL